MSEIRFRGKTHTVLEELYVGGRKFFVIERLGNHRRPTFCAVERGLTQEIRCVQLLPYTKAAMSRLRLLSRISAATNASLPEIIDSRKKGDEIVLISRWTDGPSVRDYLRQCRSGREPWPSPLIATNLVRKFVHGFRLLHDRLGIVHGDIHPGNLLLCRHTKRLVLIDFGSAWNVEHSNIRPMGDGAVRAFAAPETHSSNQAPGFRSDQYSTSAVLYELLTGEVPYDGLGGRVGEANARQSTRICLSPATQSLRHSARLPRRIGAQLDAVLSRTLAIDPNDRFATTQAWLDAFCDLTDQLQGKRESKQQSTASSWFLRQTTKLERLFGNR